MGLEEPQAREGRWSEVCLGTQRLYLLVPPEAASALPLQPEESPPSLGILHPFSLLLGPHWLPLLTALSVTDAHSLSWKRSPEATPRLPSLRCLGRITFPYSEVIK